MIAPANSPWIERFKAFDSTDEELNALITVVPRGCPSIDMFPAQQAVSQLHIFLKGIVVPSAQMRSALRAMGDIARSYAISKFPDERAFLNAVYSRSHANSEPEIPALCLTGLAGVGKSQIARSFHRILGEGGEICIQGHTHFPLTSAWRVSALGSYGIARLLSEHFRPGSGKCPTHSDSIKEARIQGICLQTVDELQFITQSGASTHAAKILLQLMQLGPPVVFVSNFSMLHLLNRRAHQERDRLLANVHIVRPDNADSEDWKCLVRVLLASLPQFSNLLHRKDIEHELHGYTFGLKRALVALLCSAYAVSRCSKKLAKVTPADLENAYVSQEYTIHRDVISRLIAGEVNQNKLAKDLFCPIESSVAPRPGSNVAPHPAATSFRKREAQEALRSTLNETERAGLEAATGKLHKATRRRAPVSNLPRPVLTSDSLIDGANHFGIPPKKRE